MGFFLGHSVWAYKEQYIPVTPTIEKRSAESLEENIPNEGNAKLEEYAIDGRYRGGRNLIYDCERDHYVCVDDVSKVNCDLRRQKQEMQKKENLSCAFFKKFSTKNECISEQYKMLEKKVKPIFCFKKHQ